MLGKHAPELSLAAPRRHRTLLVVQQRRKQWLLQLLGAAGTAGVDNKWELLN